MSEKITIKEMFIQGQAIKTAPIFGKADKAAQIEIAWTMLLVYLQQQEQHLAAQDARISELERMVKNA
ncbi:MAG: hypothetical protein WCZ98_01465 [Sideroxydans sp.]